MGSMRSRRSGPGEGGFTLLEVLVALTILAVGGVSIIALFAAAVQLQYKSAIEDQVGLLLPEIEAEAQDIVDRFDYSADQTGPEDIEWKDARDRSGYRYQVRFVPASEDLALPGEGWWIDVDVEPPGPGRAIEFPRMWFLKRQVFSAEDLERSVTWEAEREGGEDRDVRNRKGELDDR